MDPLNTLTVWHGLAGNFGLAAILVLVYNLVAGERGSMPHGIVLGCAFGSAAILATLQPLHVTPGVIVHIGSSLVALAGFLGGGPGALVAAACGMAARYWMGGAGMIAGMSSFAGVAAVGVAVHGYLRWRRRDPKPRHLALLAAGVLPVTLSSFLALPGGAGWPLLRHVGPAFTVVQLVALFLIGGLALQIQRRRRIVAETAALQQRTAAIVESTPNALVITDSDGRIRTVNAQTEAWFGYSRQELIGQPVEVLMPERFRAGHPGRRETYAARPMRRPMGTRSPLMARRKDGSEFPIDIQLNAVETAEGRQVIASIADMTAARAHEEALRRSEERLRITMNNVPGIVFRRILKPGGLPAYVFFGGRLLDQWGITGEEVMRDPSALLKHMHPDDLPLLKATLNPALDDLEPRSFLHRMYRTDGSLAWCQIESRAHRQEDGTLVRDGIILDVTGRVQAEERLKVSEQRYRMLAESIGDQILHIAADNRVLYSSPSSRQVSGYSDEERMGRSSLELVHPDDLAKCLEAGQRARETGEQTSVAYRVKHKNGEWVWLEATIRPYGHPDPAVSQELIIVARNISERRALEEQLRQAQRMEAVGQLTGGVAHEFNNLLMVISGNVEFLKEHLDGSADARELIGTVGRAVRRGAALTQGLLAFSRKQPLRPATVEVGAVLDDFARLARGVLPESLDLRFEREPGGLRATADVNQLHNAILNLVVNARDATPPSGTIVVRTRAVDVTELEARAVDAKPGRYVEISVTDTGTGMPPEVLAHAVEPFFSTKEVGQGTGLGLSMVHGFSRQSGGFLAIASEVGRGTTVRVCLPAAPADSALPAAGDGAGHASSPPAWKRAVLLVEDDPDVLRSVERMLRDLGYQVIAAADGPAALEAIKSSPQLDILLADVVMPNGMSGEDVAKAARTRFPDLRVVYMSGYSENVIVRHGTVNPGVVLLSKPFQPEDLERTLSDAVAAVPRGKTGGAPA